MEVIDSGVRFRQMKDVGRLAMLRAKSGGAISPKRLASIAAETEKLFTNIIGKESGKSFDIYANLTQLIKKDSEADTRGSLLKIDRWISLDPDLNLPILPVQIKSSFGGVDIFKKGDKKRNIKPNRTFTSLNGVIIVINCGPSITLTSFQHQLCNEIGRIKTIIDSNPSLKSLQQNK
jgi:hypothetical protein